MSFRFGLFGILFLFLLFTVIGGIVAIIAVGVVRKKKNDRAQKTVTGATVLSKQVTTQRHPVAGDTSGAHGTTTFHTYQAVFLTADHVQRTFIVDDSTYEQLTEGEHGRLTYQGTRFLGFERDGN